MAHSAAAQVSINEVIVEVFLVDKVDVVKRLQDEGKVVAMVGDGANDVAALAETDVGLAMGTDVATEASDLTLVLLRRFRPLAATRAKGERRDG